MGSELKRQIDRKWLLESQYRTPAPLESRQVLHERFSINPVGWFSWVFEQVRGTLGRSARILETGCGNGELWKRNLSRIPGAWEITLTDLSPGMVEAALEAVRRDERFTGQTADAQKLSFPDGGFDLVLTNLVLQHVADPGQALKEARRVLRAQGCLALGLTGRDHMAEIPGIMAEFDRGLAACGSLGISDFRLETAPGMLRSHFGSVEVRHYEDALVITESKPLADYLASIWPVDEAIYPELVDFLADRISRNGSICVRKVVGLAVCRV